MSFEAGFLVVDKPAGITSHDVVGALRAVLGIKKVGHTGTLDPFATGVLPLAFGGATRLISFLDESLKVYDAGIQLGSRTDTGDPTGEVVAEAAIPALTEASVAAALQAHEGEQLQTPPPYSAVKVGGKPLYWYARRGEFPEVAPRPITIHGLSLLSLEPDSGLVRVRIRCSRGTYARVLAEDIARSLGTEGHLVTLERARSGPFRLEGALGFPELAGIAAAEPGHPWRKVLIKERGQPREERVAWRDRAEVRAALEPRLLSPLEAFASLPVLEPSEAEARRLRNGQLPARVPEGVAPGGRFAVARGGRLLALAEAADPAGPPSALRVLDAV